MCVCLSVFMCVRLGNKEADEKQQVRKKKPRALTVRLQTDTERSTRTPRPLTTAVLSWLMTNQGSKPRCIYSSYPAGCLLTKNSHHPEKTLFNTLSTLLVTNIALKKIKRFYKIYVYFLSFLRTSFFS